MDLEIYSKWLVFRQHPVDDLAAGSGGGRAAVRAVVDKLRAMEAKQGRALNKGAPLSGGPY